MSFRVRGVLEQLQSSRQHSMKVREGGRYYGWMDESGHGVVIGRDVMERGEVGKRVWRRKSGNGWM